MTDVKRLLAEATPLPWRAYPTGSYITPPFGVMHKVTQLEDPWIRNPNQKADADLIVHAVNHLPDYEAAVDALEALLNTQYTLQISGHDVECDLVQTTGLPCSCGKNDALRDADAALRRLRGAA